MPIAIRVTLEDGEVLRAIDRRYLFITPLNQFWHRSGDATRQAATRESPAGKTKKFKRSWVIRYQGGDPITGFILENTDPKAPIVIGGSRPHPIVPRRPAFALRFGNPPVFRARVNHPGTRPNDVPRRARDVAAREIAAVHTPWLDAEVTKRWNSRGYSG